MKDFQVFPNPNPRSQEEKGKEGGFSYLGTARTVTTAGRRLDATREVTPSRRGREEKQSNLTLTLEWEMMERGRNLPGFPAPPSYRRCAG